MVENKTDVGGQVCALMPDTGQVVAGGGVVIVMLTVKTAEQLNWLETA